MMIICTDVAIWFIHFLMLNLLMTASNLVNLFYLILDLLMIKSYHGCPSLYGIIWTSICSWSWFSELHPLDCIPPPGDLPRVNNYSCLVACFGIQFPSDHFRLQWSSSVGVCACACHGRHMRWTWLKQPIFCTALYPPGVTVIHYI